MVRTLALIILLAACSSDGPTSPTDPTPVDGGSANYSASLGTDPDFSDAHGRIAVESWFAYGEGALQGAFADGPPLRLHTESERAGNCRLMTGAVSSCIPACAGTELCVDGTCTPWPERLDRGALEWTWPDGQQTVQPDATLGYYATGAAHEPGVVRVEVGGQSYEAPSTEAPAHDGDWGTVLDERARGADATLRWSNPMLHARVRVHMTDCVGSHGGIAPAEIECEGPDTGSLVLPGPYLDLLEDGDWTHGECGSHTFERYHSATAAGDDTVRVETVSDAGFFWFAR